MKYVRLPVIVVRPIAPKSNTRILSAQLSQHHTASSPLVQATMDWAETAVPRLPPHARKRPDSQLQVLARDP